MQYYKTKFDDGKQRLLYARVEGTILRNFAQRNRTGRRVSFWSFFHQEGYNEPRRVGPKYPSKETLLVDIDNYGAQWGF